jgi:hypothetical protein
MPPPPIERIIVQEFECEEDAFFAEKFLIALYGREDLGEGRLLNLTYGGENPPRVDHTGMERSDETKEKLRVSHLGHVHTEEHKNKISQALKGRVLSKGFLGRHLSDEHKAKVAKAMASRIISAETRRRMSESAKLRWA